MLLWRRADARQRRLALDIAIVGVVALALPALLALSHLVDVFNGRNVLETWTPWAVLIAGGIAAERAGWFGPSIGIALCALFVAVIVATETSPAYQRDDWRGASASLRRLSSSNPRRRDR